jgi:hypothetical protein
VPQIEEIDGGEVLPLDYTVVDPVLPSMRYDDRCSL